MSRRATSWAEFWDRPNRIYVNERHREVHYARLADDILAILPSGRPRVLDYGCGEALHADRIAAGCDLLHLCDSSPALLKRLRERFTAVANITIVAPEALETIADGSLDLVVASSVVQYIERERLPALLALWRRKLTPTGRLVLADVIDPTTGTAADIAALLDLARRHGFVLAALRGLAATFLSDYRRVRRRCGLTKFTEGEMMRLFDEAGLVGERRAANLGFNPARITFIARRRP